MTKKDKMICFKIKYKKLVYIFDADSVRQSWKFLFRWLKSENHEKKWDKKERKTYKMENQWGKITQEKQCTKKHTVAAAANKSSEKTDAAAATGKV